MQRADDCVRRRHPVCWATHSDEPSSSHHFIFWKLVVRNSLVTRGVISTPGSVALPHCFVRHTLDEVPVWPIQQTLLPAQRKSPEAQIAHVSGEKEIVLCCSPLYRTTQKPSESAKPYQAKHVAKSCQAKSRQQCGVGVACAQREQTTEAVHM